MILKPLNHLITLPIALLTLGTSAAEAADPLPLNPGSPWYGLDFEKGWHFDAGIGLEYEPSYAGSDQYTSEPDVFARALYQTEKGHRYFVSLGEVGAIFSVSENTQFLAFLEYEEGRDDEEDARLSGLDLIDATIEGQFMLIRRFGNTTIFGALQPDLTGDANKGLVWFAGLGYDWLSANQAWRFNTTLDLSGADSEYMRTEFGITAEEALRTSYTSYQPNAGLKSLTWNISGEYYFSDRLSLLGSLDTEYYLGDASDSPLISEEGADLGFEAGLLLRYRF